MLWLRVPEKVYFKKGSMPVALDELKTVYGKKRAFIVTSASAYKSGKTAYTEKLLDKMMIQHTVFFDICCRASLEKVKEGARAAQLFEPDVIIAVGGSGAMNAAKLIRVLYEHPEADIRELASRFSDIRSRAELFPRTNIRAALVTVPTESGTGEEVTPYACAVDGENRLTLADYELMPEFVVVDSDNMIGQSSEQISSAAMKALVHIMTALDSESATEYTDGFALKALENIIGYLPGFYENGSSDPLGCEKLAEASAMAGIAYANTCSFESCCKKAAAGLAEEMQRKSEADESVFARYVSYADAVGINADDEREKVNKLISKIRELTAIGSK